MPIAEKSSSDILDLIGLITGKSGSTSGSKTNTSTQTTKANISDAGIKEMIDQILAGPGGISSIANAEHSAGLYGGSTATLLTNNLVTQTAAKLAAAQAGTTTTNSGTETSQTSNKTDPTINPLKAGGALLAGSVLNNILQGAGVGGLGGAAGSIADLLKSGGSGLAGLLKGVTGSDGTGVDPGNAGYNAAQDTGLVNSTNPTDSISPGVGQFLDYGPATTTIPISSLFPSSGSNGYDNAGYPDAPIDIPDNTDNGPTDEDYGP